MATGAIPFTALSQKYVSTGLEKSKPPANTAITLAPIDSSSCTIAT